MLALPTAWGRGGRHHPSPSLGPGATLPLPSPGRHISAWCHFPLPAGSLLGISLQGSNCKAGKQVKTHQFPLYKPVSHQPILLGNTTALIWLWNWMSQVFRGGTRWSSATVDQGLPPPCHKTASSQAGRTVWDQLQPPAQPVIYPIILPALFITHKLPSPCSPWHKECKGLHPSLQSSAGRQPNHRVYSQSTSDWSKIGQDGGQALLRYTPRGAEQGFCQFWLPKERQASSSRQVKWEDRRTSSIPYPQPSPRLSEQKVSFRTLQDQGLHLLSPDLHRHWLLPNPHHSMGSETLECST